MPELAEVEYYRKQWLPAIGQTVIGVNLNRHKRVFRGVNCTSLSDDLIHQKFSDSLAHGKQLCFRFGESCWLGVHLGMTGSIRIISSSEQLAKHDHLVFHMNDSSSLVFSDARMFGRIIYSKSGDVPDWWTKRPPAILSSEFTFERLDAFISRRNKSAIKSVLLRQDNFPGIGNWMADEILWRSRISPVKLCREIDLNQRKLIYVRTREVASDAMCVIGTDWNTPPDNWLFNHRWGKGGKCPQTGQPLMRTKVGGRTTCWSPSWQT